ncbi:MAG: helix-turn-helix domain-containing protein [Lachnospiraceae bacterium]|nr:helix-turn-helix domain-containing protein [Lachnospiraceae bacterium]
MTISDHIFQLLKERGMSQKEFSEATGIAQGAISDWKRKRTNPSADKILIISETLGVDPSVLLSGKTTESKKAKSTDYMILSSGSEEKFLVETYQDMDVDSRKRLMEYAKRLSNEK